MVSNLTWCTIFIANPQLSTALFHPRFCPGKLNISVNDSHVFTVIIRLQLYPSLPRKNNKNHALSSEGKSFKNRHIAAKSKPVAITSNIKASNCRITVDAGRAVWRAPCSIILLTSRVGSRRCLGGVAVIFLRTVGVVFLSDSGSLTESFLDCNLS